MFTCRVFCDYFVDYSVLDESTTTAFKKPKYPQAIIDAAVTLESKSSAAQSTHSTLIVVLSLIFTVYIFNNNVR